MNDLSESRVLIVDDVKANVDVLVEALRADYKLSVALNGETALRLAEKNPPDLILLDVLMPGLDGFEVCRRLRALAQTREVPIMFLTGLQDVQNKTQGFEAGGNDYLTKPFEVLEVKARVRSLLKAKAYSDAVREKTASELRIAREIQLGILPANIPARTQGSGLDVHAILEPALEVGGDLYDVVRTASGRVMFAVGDVSGKGVPASLFMAVTTTLIRTIARQCDQPDEIIRQVNEALVAQNPRDMFVTLFCTVFDPATGKLLWASAGHPPPVLLRPGNAPELAFTDTGFVAGILPAIAMESHEAELRPGDSLVFYTDGVTEAFNAAGEMFGESRLITHLAEKPGGTAAETVASVLAAVREFAGERQQSDDITIVAIRREE
jgi:phosphoserine phosphatase RsbU/P